MANKGRVTIEVVLRNLATAGIVKLQTSLRGLGTFARTAGLRIAGLVTAFTGLTTVGVAAWLLKTNREFEKFLAQLRTFEGSAEAARSTFTVLERFAAETPFQIEESVRAFVTLRSMGIQPTEKMLRTFGDTASAMGGKIDDFALAVKSLATGEIQAMKSFGVTAGVEGNKIRIMFQDMAITVPRNAQAVADALETIGATKFAGAMKREMETLNGAISNLEDNLGRIARAIGEAGFTGGSKSFVERLVAWTGRLADNKPLIEQWVAAVVDSLAIVRASFREFLAYLGTVEARWDKFNAFMSTRLNDTPNMLAENMRRHTALVEEADAAFKRAVEERTRLINDRARRFQQSSARMADAALRGQMDGGMRPGDFAGIRDDKLGGDRGLKGLSAPEDTSKADTAAEKLEKRIALLAQLGETGNMSLRDIARHEHALREELLHTQATIAERVELEQKLLEIRLKLAQTSGAIADVPAIDRIIRQQQEQGMTPGAPTVPIDPLDLPSGDPAELDPTTVWQRMDEQINQGKTSLESLRDTIDDITTGALVSFGDAIMNAFAAMITGSESAGAAMAKAVLGFIASAAKALGDFYIAKAIASFASVTGTPPNPLGAVAGKKFLLAAAGMYALAGAVGGAGTAIGGGAGGGGAARGFGATNGFAAAAKNDAYLIIEGDFLDLNNPITKQRFKRAMEELTGRRVHVRNNRFSP